MTVAARELARFAREWGVHLPGTTHFVEDGWKQDFTMAMDAQPSLVTVSSAGIPAFLTTMIDPEVIRALLTPNDAVKILGEVKRGTWIDKTIMFTMIERTGEVSSYGDFNNNGRAGINVNFPQRQSYLYQIIKEWGEWEMEVAGAARIGWAAEIDESAVTILNKFQNFTYFFGVQNLACYGLLNDPTLAAPLTPSIKSASSSPQWMLNGRINATANEVYGDVQAMVEQLVSQSNGVIKMKDPMIMALSPQSEVALTATNSFNVNVNDLLKKNFPNIRIETAVQYGQVSATNPQGIVGGSLVQLIAEKVDGKDLGFMAFNEKLRSHPVIRQLSSFQQKQTQGTWGAVIRYPAGIAQMLGV